MTSLSSEMFSNSNLDLKDEISSVIPGVLYISGYRPVKYRKSLENLGIRKVVRLGDKSDFENVYSTLSGIEYHDIIIEDSVKSHLTPQILDGCIKFIADGPALVHCFAGISRSATVVIAYLMKKQNMGVKEARLFLKTKRGCISPNSTFMRDLVKYRDLEN